MDEYGNQKPKKFVKKLLGTNSIYEDFCDNISENKHWPFEDYGSVKRFYDGSKGVQIDHL